MHGVVYAIGACCAIQTQALNQTLSQSTCTALTTDSFPAIRSAHMVQRPVSSLWKKCGNYYQSHKCLYITQNTLQLYIQTSQAHKRWQQPITVYRKTSNIRRTSVGNKIIDHSNVVGTSPVGAAPTTSSFSTWHLASRDSTKKTARQYENLLSFGIWCVLYWRLDGTSDTQPTVRQPPG